MRDRYSEFYQLIDSYFSDESVAMIDKALRLADESLRGALRYDGSPIVEHSIRCAQIVISEIGLGRNSTISTLLHDVVRLGKLSAKDAGSMFGEQCSPLLMGLCNISGVQTKVSSSQADNFRDLIVSYSTDPRVILIKLADRLEVMRSLSMFPSEKRIKKSWESLNLYAQIAHKLGLYSIKSELEDISLSFLEPEQYQHINSRLKEMATERELFMSRFLEPIEDKLSKSGIKYKIKSRAKSIFSIWNKMQRTGVSVDEVYDIFALRIIIDCPLELEKHQCWATYSIVTDFYTPNPKRMRDWISIPKSNGYESLHATVVTKGGEWVEIQIRTDRMDVVAERGIAAHWRYKGVNQGGMSSEEWLERVREMMEEDTQSIGERFDSSSSSINEVFVFTPQGDIRKLPEGATLLDLAFDIHSNLGIRCIGGKINRRNVQMKEPLRSGDIVEVTTSKTQHPKQDWLNIVTTNKARNRIRSFLREEQSKQSSLGREELERRLKNWKFSITIDDAVSHLCKSLKLKTGVDLYSQIAAGKIDLMEIKELLTRYHSGDEGAIQPILPAKSRSSSSVKNSHGGSDDALIIDDTIRNLEYNLGKCCNPIFGDDVFGFVTINSGITIHRRSCPNATRLKEQYPYRVMAAKWRRSQEGGAFMASIRIVAENRTGIVNQITEVVTQDLKVNIRSMSLTPNGKGQLAGLIDIEVVGSQMVDFVIHSIMRIKGVTRAYRVNS